MLITPRIKALCRDSPFEGGEGDVVASQEFVTKINYITAAVYMLHSIRNEATSPLIPLQRGSRK